MEYGRPIGSAEALNFQQTTPYSSALPNPYSDRFGTSLSADKTLFKERLISSGNTTLYTVPDKQTVIVSNVWIYLTNTASPVVVQLRHTLADETPVTTGDTYWGTTLGSTSPWAIVQVQKVLEAGSILTINVDVGSVINVNGDGILVETQ